MDEQFPRNESLPPQSDQEIKAMLRRIEQRLDFLENKIDTLISNAGSRPAQERHFPRPFRQFGHPHHRHERGKERFSGERDFENKNHFEKRRDGDDRGFEPGRKKGFGGHKKPFSFKRREHR